MNATSESTGFTSTLYLILIQVISRGLTFVGNQIVLRYVSPGHLGLAVQFETLSISVLYTSRESLRVALQRLPQKTSEQNSATKRTQSQSAVNVGSLVVLLGLLLGSILGYSYLLPAGPELLLATDFKLAFWLYALATIVEILSEPGFIVVQQYALYKVRARAETSAAVARCVAGCLSVLIMHRLNRPLSVLPFAIGQVCYAGSLFIVYIWHATSVASSEGFSIFPKSLSNHSDTILSTFPRPLLALAGAFYGQSIFKWLLTQGDTLILSLFADLEVQGIFALASNYGGLSSRLLFQPVEESSRNAFGRLLFGEDKESPNKSITQSTPSPTMSRQQQALDYLATTLRAYILVILMPCITILPELFPILISALLGPNSRWNSPQTRSLFQVYSYYIPVLAINGILDAFVTSVATEAQLGIQSLVMLLITIVYLGAAYFGMSVMKIGAVGLVYANILNMLLRITFSLWFIRSCTRQDPSTKPSNKKLAFSNFCQKSLPTTACLLSFLVTLIALFGENYIRQIFADTVTVQELSAIKFGSLDLDMFHVSYLFSAAVVLISSIVLTEREFLLLSVEPLLPGRVRQAIASYVPRRE